MYFSLRKRSILCSTRFSVRHAVVQVKWQSTHLSVEALNRNFFGLNRHHTGVSNLLVGKYG
jgi:hypothetical protein